MKRLTMAAILLVVGFSGYAAGEDLMEKDLRILVDQYTAAAGYGQTEGFATHFRSYMIGSNRLDAAAEQQRKLYSFGFDTSISQFETAGDKASYVVTSAHYESSRGGKTLTKGKVTATYSVRPGELILVMIKFSDDMVRFNDTEKSANRKAQEKERGATPSPGPNPVPDFRPEKEREREI